VTRAPERRVVVVGNLTIDDVVLPDGTTRMGSVGGNSIYAALAARLWHPSVGVVTRRGADFPAESLRRLADAGVDLGGVVEIPGPTVRNWVVYEDSGERHWLYRTPPGRSVEVAVRPGDLPERWLQEAAPPVVHVAAMPLPAAAAVVDAVRRRRADATITLDTHEDWAAGFGERVRAVAERVNVFVPSREELAGLVGYDHPELALEELRGWAVRGVVVKLGADGALCWRRGEPRPALVGVSPGPVADVTGAGDAFCGGLAAGLAIGLDLVEAARRGAVSAGLTVAGFGSLRLDRAGPSGGQDRLAAAPPPVTVLPGRGPAPGAPGAPGDPVEDPSGIEVMGREIATIPAVVGDQLTDRDGAAAALARRLAADDLQHLYLVGCGDSAFAGLAAALAFARHAGVHAEAVHAIDLCRYRVRYLPKHSAVLCVSASGKVGRTIEAATQARASGHLVIALTGDDASPLAAEASELLPLEVPTFGTAPGTSTYAGALSRLLDLAFRWGAARDRHRECARDALERTPGLAEATLRAAAEPAERAAERLAGRPWVAFLGAGPNEATARFGAAKLLEGPQLLGVATNLEEWAHEEYFVTGAGMPVVVTAHSGASWDRAAEILAEIAYIGAEPIVVSDRPPPVPARRLPVAAGLPEELSPLLTALPLCLLGFQLARAAGKRGYNFASEAIAAEHYDTIHRVTIGEPA
jgi:fructoselysine-6-P-deglycase FrlB-like protein/sugar/nucleoside kinase (ribokinase family)